MLIPDHLISIIIPAYNHEKYITQCLESFLTQTYSNLELVILNDGSTDDTHSKITFFLEKHGKKFTNVEYINKKNEGVSKTLNTGMKLAKGKFVLVLASDDFAFSDSAIEKQLSLFYNSTGEDNQVGVACGDMCIVDEQNKIVAWDSCRRNISINSSETKFKTTTSFYASWRRDFDGFEYLSDHFGSYDSLLISHYMPNGCLIRKSALEEVGYYTENICTEDWDIWLKISKNYKFKFTPEILFAYRWHTCNTQKTREKEIRRDIFNLITKEKDYCYKNNKQEKWKLAFKLSRSGLAGHGDYLFLQKQCILRGEDCLVSNTLLFCMHQFKAILKVSIPKDYFTVVKNFVRKKI